MTSDTGTTTGTETGTETGTDTMGYVFDNHSPHAGDQHRCLAAALDPISTGRLELTGLTEGWACWEVGAGGGSIARWLARRVAPTGRVLATDIKPDHLAAGPGLRVARHDVVRDPVPETSFDLIHARLVLQHLPERREVLARLAGALRPGGWLQLDEFDVEYGPVLLAPDRAAARLYERFLAAKADILAGAGADIAWGRHAPDAMRAAGLVEVDPVPYLLAWGPGHPGVGLLIHHTRQLRDRFVRAGFTDTDLAEVRALLGHPGFRATSCVIYSIHGRRPAR